MRKGTDHVVGGGELLHISLFNGALPYYHGGFRWTEKFSASTGDRIPVSGIPGEPFATKYHNGF